MSNRWLPGAPDGNRSAGRKPTTSQPETRLAWIDDGRYGFTDGDRLIEADAEDFVEVRQ